MKRILPLHEMAKNLGLISESLHPKRGRRSFFTNKRSGPRLVLGLYSYRISWKITTFVNLHSTI